jgi:hypothetical protein
VAEEERTKLNVSGILGGFKRGQRFSLVNYTGQKFTVQVQK